MINQKELCSFFSHKYLTRW